jgi:hypothetical protein
VVYVALMTDRYPQLRLDQGSVDVEGPAQPPAAMGWRIIRRFGTVLVHLGGGAPRPDSREQQSLRLKLTRQRVPENGASAQFTWAAVPTRVATAACSYDRSAL